MALTSGTRLGPCEILAPIGKGGMGEVYRARDKKLERDVAIKVLPEPFVNDEGRLARFEREAKLLASLNHPNIASIHGLEESDGVKALVLELVEGPTLAERIQEGPISVEETLAISRQITAALEAGHEAGVIHRDLKPANVFSPDGEWVGFHSILDGQLKKVAVRGGAPVNLCAAQNLLGARWGADDTIVFGQRGAGIMQVSADGGTPEVLIPLTGTEEIGHGPQVLPGEKAVLFTLADGTNWDDAQIVVYSLKTGERKVLIDGGRDARYVPTGHVVYVLDGTLLAVPFDVDTLEVVLE